MTIFHEYGAAIAMCSVGAWLCVCEWRDRRKAR